MKKWAVFVVLSIAVLLWSLGPLAQVEFRKARLVFSNGQALSVEIADSPDTQAKGLSDRMQLGPDEGMLFVFPTERRMSFWMRDTYVPLSIGFFDKNRKLMSTRDMEAQVLMARKQNLRTYHSDRPGLFALEVNQGWFEQNHVVEGMGFEWTPLE